MIKYRLFPSLKNQSKLFKGILALSMVFTFVGCNQAIAEQTIKLVGDPWPPYVNGELGKDATSGVAVEIAKKIFSQIDGVEVRFPLIPWKRALREVEEGQSDGIGLLLKTAERERYMIYTVPLVIGEGLIWSATGGISNPFEWTSIKDLYGRSIGIIQAYSYGDELDHGIETGDLTVITAPTVGHLFAMLANGRIELALANDAVGYSQVHKFPNAGIMPAKLPIVSETFYMGISRKSPAVELVPAINRAIESLRAAGTIDLIVRGE